MDYLKYLKKCRKKPLVDLATLESNPVYTSVDYGPEMVKKLIPHRNPFLLVDRLTGIGLAKDEEFIIGTRYLDEKDPVFSGHFPEYPVYPGALQVEMGGQLGLCLTHFMLNNTTLLGDDVQPVNVRATRLLGALFLEPLLPGREATIIAKRLEYDGYFGKVISQVLDGTKVTSVSIAEVMFVD